MSSANENENDDASSSSSSSSSDGKCLPECPICKEEIPSAQEARFSCKCYAFHVTCARSWSRINNSCPCCRTGRWVDPRQSQGGRRMTKGTRLVELMKREGGSHSTRYWEQKILETGERELYPKFVAPGSLHGALKALACRRPGQDETRARLRCTRRRVDRRMVDCWEAL